MDEFHTPLLVEVDPSHNLNDLLAARVGDTPDRVVVEHQSQAGGPWIPLTAREFDAEIVAVAKGLVARGVQPGDRVGIMSRTRYEWSLVDWAAWAAGAVPVPLYETSSAEQVEWILTDSAVTFLVVESSAHRAVVEEVRPATSVREVLVIDDGAIEQLVAAGADVADEEVARRRRLAVGADVATIIYTSGTTGRPKGVELTHGNFAELTVNAVAGLQEVVAGDGARTLLFMPLAHVFARFIEVLCIPAGAVLGHTPDTKTLVADLGTFRPTFVLSVPRVFEKVYNSAEQKAAAGGKGPIFQRAAKTAIVYSRALDTPRGPSPWLRLQHKVADVLVLHKLRAALGGRAEWAISGGAPLGERLGHFYRGVGLKVLEGYGLTETTAPATVNRPGKTKIGTVGLPLPGTAIRIAADGEVEIKGVQVFRGYHANDAATQESLVDGWFRTGDLGALDEDGFLTITGRKKEIIVTAGGKNVAPTILEDRLRAHPLISQVVVVGDQRPFIGALITLDPEGVPGWLTAHGKPQMSLEEARTDPDVLASIEKAVAKTNRAVSRAESIRKYRILDRDLTLADGYLTPKLSIRRAVVLKDFAADVDALYTDERE
ncbi:AMP-dependent synthetase/ligase [Cellulomonas fimi]|uniref:Acyl-CoA synthetase n=1 Tax=Cellulomonas fimi (strain ATCC 484 / DSM 20113 / JCM 1341 / CCUG 24087 / LMG 16345 / NBRC 15513 / NCIMB 8980 / NCTC 7547 / NRS-133) TaxID=590998 RepID=F4H1K4_CELFA|nr:AMP-dependent synthetase/ligase [Cellulomonas fimi]AEE46303.1 AMP-dependent synthetase and ligase [Cellulomonas fimi ATCC 484]NNH06241.1 long-chain fatty acid--CoA ligase [Cellulomonas fimi]VEH32447.1 Long-chain-fatty-acid--CoA ligase FadD15 [Cellulomonas fimi]